MKTKAKPTSPDQAISDIMNKIERGPIGQAFHLMGIAEDEISAGKRRHPAKAKEIQSAFMAFQPYHQEFWQAPDDVFRAHCREIADRVASSASLVPATDAEILYGMHTASQKAPPSDHFSLLYQRLFIKCLPSQNVIKKDDPMFRESWPNAVNELYSQFKSKLRVEGRGAIPEEIKEIMQLAKVGRN